MLEIAPKLFVVIFLADTHSRNFQIAIINKYNNYLLLEVWPFGGSAMSAFKGSNWDGPVFTRDLKGGFVGACCGGFMAALF